MIGTISSYNGVGGTTSRRSSPSSCATRAARVRASGRCQSDDHHFSATGTPVRALPLVSNLI